MVVKDIGKRFVFIVLAVTLIALMAGNVCAEEVNNTNVDTVTPVKSVNVEVNYEYTGDNAKVMPDFYIYSGEDKIEYNKELINSNSYVLTFNDTFSKEYNITAMTAGYVSQSQIILSDSIIFNLKASDAYKLGYDVTADADKILDFKTADDILVITSAGVPKYNSRTSEDAVEAIYNYQYKYGQSIPYNNVLMLRQTAVDNIDFAFIVKRGNELKAVIYEKASKTPVYVATISENMTRVQWNNYFNSLSGENAWAFASLTNAWVAGASNIILQEAAFHGHVCEGTLGGYSIVQALLKYYSPVGASDYYDILGVPGGSDDDAVIYFLDATPGKIGDVGINMRLNGYIGFNTTSTGVSENMIGFIRWGASSGTLIIMEYNKSKITALFEKETGINPKSGSLEELKYNTWWVKNIKNNPEKMADILYEFDNLTRAQYFELIGDGKTVEARGLDLDYILSLNLPKATRNSASGLDISLSDKQIEQIGVDATNLAISIFKNQKGIDITKDMVDLSVLTSAGYVYLGSSDTVLARNGINKVLGATLTSATLLPIHTPAYKPLWFAYVLRSPDSDILDTVFIKYNPDGTFFVGEFNGSNVADVGINSINNSATVKALSSKFAIDESFFGVQSIGNVWMSHPEFDQLLSFLFHSHACPGVQPGFFITDFIQENFPLGENESYKYIGSSIYCKDDSLIYLLGISPGMGDYFLQKLPGNETDSTYADGAKDEGVLIVWDSNLNIGRAVIITYTSAKLKKVAVNTPDANRHVQIQTYLDIYAKKDNPLVISKPTVESNEEKWITYEQYLELTSGSKDLNALSYLKGLPSVSKEDLLNSMKNNSESNSNSNTNTNSNSDSNANENSHSSANVNNVGVSSNYNNMPQSSSYDVGNSNDVLGSDSEVSEDEGKSYEVSKKSPAKSINPDYMPYVVIVILIVGILVGAGYMKHRK